MSAYHELMQLGAVRGAFGPGPGARLLVPERLRRPAAALLAACVAVTAMAGVRMAGYGLPGWLDAAFGPRIQAHLSRHPVLLDWLPGLGTLVPVAVMTLALGLACALARRWRGVLLAVASVPVAIGLTEYVLKPSVGEAIGQPFPSGHATSMFALAASCAVLLADSSRRRVPGAVRLLLAVMAVLLAAAVAVAMVAIGAHYVTDAVAGAAVGTGVVLACAFTLDMLAARLRRGPAAPPGPGE
jgi:membrane-associated phospholipid phosphatase